MKQLSLLPCVLLLILAFSCACCPRPKKTIETVKKMVVCQYKASEQYLVFSEQAEKEGLVNVSNFFEAIAYSERVQAKYLQQFLSQYDETVDVVIDSIPIAGSLIDNLNTSSQIQVYKTQPGKLPACISEAEREEALDICVFLEMIADVSHQHAELCRKVLLKLDSDSSGWTVVNSWSVCPMCGYPYKTAALRESCHLCGECSNSFVLFQ